MNYLPKSLATGFLLAFFASSSVMAAATHPVTGETLADDQTFTLCPDARETQNINTDDDYLSSMYTCDYHSFDEAKLFFF